MTVINPNSISGITSITMPSGDGNVLTVHTNDGTERFRIDSSGNVKVGSACTISPDGDVFFTGVTTATTFTGAHSGSGANLTSLPAGNLTGALPAISGANLTGIAATDNVRTGILDVAGVSTFRNTMNVGAAVTISESGIEASGIGITVANINGTSIGGRRNIIINGAMLVAQRGTSSTTSGYSTIDRWVNSYSHDATMTFTQHALTSSDSGPYEEGFRYSNHVTNGDTVADAGQYYVPQQPIEAQNISMSGWNYKSSTGYITLSFWVKSSVGQTYQASLMTTDGTIYNYPFSFTLSADTWTKVIKTIPGNSNLQIDNDTGEGVRVNICPYMGTTYTSSGVNYDTWAAWGSGTRFKDFTSTWWTTNSATFEFTGVQLEVGSQSTAFEHCSFGEELALCQRYYIRIATGTGKAISENATQYNSSSVFLSIPLPTEMRAQPTLDVSNGTGHFVKYANNGPVYIDTFGRDGVTTTQILCINGTGSGTAGHACMIRTDDASSYVGAISEL